MINIRELESKIVERLKPLDPEKIILFGSYASGNPGEDSDIDLYVVTKDDFIPQNYTEKKILVRKVSKQIQDIRQSVSVDLLVHTKKMSKKFFDIGSSFSKELAEKGKILYG